VVVATDGFDGDVVDDLDALVPEFVTEQPAEVRVDGGHDRRGLLDQGDGQAAAGERLGHLQADVAAPDDDGGAGAGGQGMVEGEGVVHGVQHMHPVQVQALDRGADRDRPGGHHQPVIGQRPLAAISGVGDGDLLAGRVDGPGGVVQHQPHPGLFQVGDGAVGQRPPVGHVA